MEPKKLFLDQDDKKIAGVCSGLACFFDIDVTLIRILMLIALFLGTTGLWIYISVWVVAPAAVTPAQKCRMHGLPATAENMARFTSSSAK